MVAAAIEARDWSIVGEASVAVEVDGLVLSHSKGSHAGDSLEPLRSFVLPWSNWSLDVKADYRVASEILVYFWRQQRAANLEI
jgi:hypothetical protein